MPYSPAAPYSGTPDIGFGGQTGAYDRGPSPQPGVGSTPYPASPYGGGQNYGPGQPPQQQYGGGQPQQQQYGGGQAPYGAGGAPPPGSYQQPPQQPPQTNVSPYMQNVAAPDYNDPSRRGPSPQPPAAAPAAKQPSTQPAGCVPTGKDIPGLDPSLAAALGQLKLYGGMDSYKGTIVPAPHFNEEEDVMALRKAMKGAGTDEKALIDIVSKRSNFQRQQIRKYFKTMVGKDLIKELKGELSGNFDECMTALFRETTYYDAYSLRKAIKGAGTDERVLIEILCTRTNSEIRDIVQCYKDHFGRDLEKDIIGDTSGHFKRLLVSCCQANRQELTDAEWDRFCREGPESVVDRAKAKQEAMELYKAGEKKLGTDEATFLKIMSLRHCYQLRATFEEYAVLSGRDILNSVAREMSDDLQHGFEAVIMSQRDRPEYFADRLYKSMKGAGTDDSALIRIVVSRSEIDLQNIKKVFLKKYRKTLWKMIEGDTSGDYRKVLVGIVGTDT